jgi:type IX secretion system PorP/SprF family membrane protein
MKKAILLFTILQNVAVLYAQQDPIHAQYLLNPIVINPAHAGVNNNLSATVSYRKQWTGMEGQPLTMLASGSISLVENRVGLGVILSHDKTGISTNTEFNAVFSYKVKLAERRVLSFGLQGGAMQFRNDYSLLNPYDIDDPAFTGVESFSRVNIGAGLLYKSDRLMVGISVPRMLPSTIKNGIQNFDLYSQHLYAFGAYRWQLSARMQFKPSVLLRAVQGSDASVDVAFNFNIDGKYTAGLFSRNLNTYGVLLQALLLEKYVLGYAFELPSGSPVDATYTTHEISIGMRLSVLRFHEKINNGI